MIPLPQGGAALRLGSRFGAHIDPDFDDVTGDGVNYRHSTFHIDGTNDLVLVWRPSQLRIYNPDGMVLLQQLATPYPDDELPLLSFTQSRLEMIILSPRHRPRILRVSGFVFELVDSAPPFQDPRLKPPVFNFGDPEGSPRAPVIIKKDYQLTLSGTADTQELWVNISRQPQAADTVAVVDKNDDGSTQEQLLKAFKINRGTRDDTVTVGVAGPRTFDISYEYWGSIGDGTGDVSLYPDSVDVTLVDNLAAAGGSSQSTAEPLWSGPFYMLRGGVYYRCTVSHRSTADNEPGVGADWESYWVATGPDLPEEDVDVSGTWNLNRSYFPRDRGWPTLGTFHEQRLILNGPPTVPHALAGGRTSDTEYLDFTLGVNPADGVLFLVANERGLAIKWFLSQRKLFIGTSRGVYVQLEIPLTPTSVGLERHSALSSAVEPALAVGGELLYLQGNRRQVRKVQYVRDIDSWEGRDMTIFAEHLLTKTQTLRDWTYGNEVDSIIWAVRDDGVLLSMTYDANYDVAAWAKHNIGAPVLSVETVGVGNEEHLVMMVQRSMWDPATGQHRVRPTLESIEATSINMYQASPDFDTGDVPGRHLQPSLWTYHVDAYETFVGDGTSSVTIPRFANQRVRVIENGVILDTVMASRTGLIQLDTITTVGAVSVVGVNYTGRLVPNRIQFMTRDGTTQSQKVRWTRPVLRLFASTMPLVNGERPRERAQADNYDVASELFSGDVDIINLGTDTDLTIEVDQSLPCHLTGIFGLLTVEEG
jgi:hypothetical protein